MKKELLKILVGFFFIHSINCFYEVYNNETFQNTTNRQTILEGGYTLLYNTNTKIPTSFQLIFRNQKYNFFFNFEQATGAINDYATRNSIYLKNSLYNTVTKANASSLSYGLYYDRLNNAIATVVSNADLNAQGIKTRDPFRPIVSCFCDGYQINLTPAIFVSKNKVRQYMSVFQEYQIQTTIDEEGYDNETISTFESALDEENVRRSVYHSRSKRAINGRPANLFVEYLIVLDNAMYTKFRSLFNTTNNDLLYQYIKIFYSHLVNGIDFRYKLSLKNDPDLMISVKLANILIFNNPVDTPWTNVSITGVPGIPIYNGMQTALATTCFNVFAESINNRSSSFNFTFDHAVAILSLDLWSTFGSSSSRSGAIGYSIIGGIGGKFKYSIVEDIGFNNIQNAAHELGHNLGASHDGSGNAIKCPASLNNIMTDKVGLNSNVANLYYFSNCSKNSFKSTLLTPDYKNYTSAGLTLLNVPVNTLSSYFNTSTYLPGQLFNIEDQCKAVLGPKSSYAPCKIPNDPICFSLYCSDPLTGQCIATTGYGALDGTPCATNYVCWKGSCVSSKNLVNSTVPTCTPNPCKNGGLCINKSPLIFCSCSSSFGGQYCENVLPTTSTKTTGVYNQKVTNIRTFSPPKRTTKQNPLIG